MKESTIRLGQIYISPTVEKLIHPEDVQEALRRHERCDWGDCSLFQKVINDRAVQSGDWIISEYHDRQGRKFTIDTRTYTSVTTLG